MAVVEKVLISIPTAERVGMFPAIIVFSIGVLIFYLSFQYFFFDLSYSLTLKLVLDPMILDVMTLLALPTCLLYCFIVSQVRIRLCWKMFNTWSILHTISFIVSFLTCLMYIIARPEATLMSLQQSLASQQLKMGSLITFCKKICPETSSLWKSFNDPSYSGYTAAMGFTSYAFPIQLVIAALYTSFTCSMFGEREVVVMLKQVEQNKFLAICEDLSVKLNKLIPKKDEDIQLAAMEYRPTESIINGAILGKKSQGKGARRMQDI
ncbi:Conserved_hypothetical protein [Hexamita inflata]|uniref:Uncharacterized protein n=1 Tax=Hexamita inflata TaxID=28002 RepID=A0AA86UFI3_9EUKA|nr:Conserved hypothetical protein [Hexamita inflata]